MEKDEVRITAALLAEIILHGLNISQRPKARVFCMKSKLYLYKQYEKIVKSLCSKVMPAFYLS